MLELPGYAIITHTDIDGVAGGGLYAYYDSEWPTLVYFTEPYRLSQLISSESGKLRNVGKIVIIDLGINPETYGGLLESISRLVKHGVVIEWFDHHLWEDKWMRDIRGLGVRLFLDTSTCATGVVYKYASRRNTENPLFPELVQGVCAGDLWLFDHWRGGWYLRLIKRRDSDSWRLKVMKEIFKGRIWTESFTNRVERVFDEELKAYSTISPVAIREKGGVRLVASYDRDEIENSFLAAFLMSRYSAQVAVIVSKDGKVSLRSRGIDVRRIALELGGGGHMYASGFKIEIPWRVRFLSLLDDTAVLDYVLGKVVSLL
ncbi:DHH family phosphoesterase [Thermogladius sp. 4427co]|uniref:DHH family phosphoesterase n=1 Tax=Thermogladius sp. 4427co TaxID=3450718 RepID=UPI003F79E5A0